MQVKPYSQDSDKKQQIEKMFDSIAPTYDLLNKVLSLGIDKVWRKKAISLLKPHQPNYILDVATGTADFALESCRQLDPVKVVGIDISSRMLEIGRKKISHTSYANKIVLESGDSENISYKSESFDAVTVAFGVRNYENLDQGLIEMYRVLKSGGLLVILEFTKPNIFPFKQVFNLYFKYILPVIGRIKSRDPKAYRYLYESVQAFPDYDQFTKKLESIGFKSSAWKSLSFGICAVYTAIK